MQWDKVKNILLVVLLLVDGFLGLTVLMRYGGAHQQQKAFAADLTTILARDGVQYNASGATPTQSRIMPLEAERSRAAEEQMARALLLGEVRLETAESGGVIFSGANGFVSWQSDGTVYATITAGETIPASENQLETQAEELLKSCGVSMRGGSWETNHEENTTTLTTTIDGFPVFNRRLTVVFQEDQTIEIAGKWSFETPYTGTNDEKRVCNVADALLYLTEQTEIHRIDQVELGYLMLPGSSGRYQLAPNWRIETDQGVWLVDALKKSVEQAGNIVK